MAKTSAVFSLLLFLSFFYACAPSATQKLYQAPPPSAAVFQDTLPFELREGFIVVRVRLNDKTMPLDFIWDSGAPVSTISQATRQYLGLPDSMEPNAITQLDSLMLHTVGFTAVPVKIAAYDNYAGPKCIAEAGIIGANIIRHCNWHIDFDQQLLFFSDKAQQPAMATAAYSLDFRTSRYGQPALKVETGPMGKTKAIASIGHAGPVRVGRKKLPDAGVMIYDRGVVDRFATDIDTAVIFQDTDFSTGALSWQGPLKVQVGRQSQIGNGLWAQYNVALNFGEETIQLYPRSASPAPPPSLPALGWMPHFTPKSDLTVGFIVVGSPAWKAGLRMGDVIDQIDRRASPGWYNDYCAYLSKVQAQFATPRKMQVFKDGAKQPISLSTDVQP